MLTNSRLLNFGILSLLVSGQALAATGNGYVWKNVAIGGGGFVTGIVVHPAEPDLVYIRTDVGGAYRWDGKNERWAPLTESIAEKPRFGIESIAVDPSNPDVVYIAAGNYGGVSVDAQDRNQVMVAEHRSAVGCSLYRSTDGGAHWSPLNYTAHADVPWWPGGWWSAAIAGLVMDPVASHRVWITDWFGVWRTDDVRANPSKWYTTESGHEEVVVFALRAPPKGARLLSGHADVGGFRHDELDRFPQRKFGPWYLLRACGCSRPAPRVVRTSRGSVASAYPAAMRTPLRYQCEKLTMCVSSRMPAEQ